MELWFVFSVLVLAVWFWVIFTLSGRKPDPDEIEYVDDEIKGDGSDIIDGILAREILKTVKKELWVIKTDEGTRIHNSLCRWYEKGNGSYLTDEDDGTDCGLCGGRNPIVREWNITKTEDEDIK